MARALIHLPSTPPRRGEVIEVRVLIAHAMESGFRVDSDGRVRPRDLIRQFSCHLDEELVFSAELSPAIAANPYLAFPLACVREGTLVCRWAGDNGFAQTERVALRLA